MSLIFLRNEIRKLIDQNPTIITIKRNNLVSDGMDGFIKNGTSTIETTIRLYKNNYHTEVITDSGVSYKEVIKALCMHDADTTEGDTFVVDGITYKVKNVDSKKYYASVISKEALLERVK